MLVTESRCPLYTVIALPVSMLHMIARESCEAEGDFSASEQQAVGQKIDLKEGEDEG